jgi:membrane-bound lytic murein transglycosylase B
MIPRILAAILIAAALAPPARAQLVKPNSVQFEQFVADLWPDAQAKGITRGTFIRAFDGVTPDPKVIATTKKQPEYGKPAGLYINQIASPRMPPRAARKRRSTIRCSTRSKRNIRSSAGSSSPSGGWRPPTAR